jgi:hypothetical protein
MVGQLMKNGLERMWKEAAMAFFVVSWHMHGGIKENQEKSSLKLKVRR